MLRLLISLLPVLSLQAAGYSVEVIAGSNFVGDGGLASSASLQDAEGICVDRAGNVYVADAGDHRVRKIAADGLITTFAGNGTPGTLNLPYSVSADASGNIYIADLGNNRIRKIAPDGTAGTVLDHLASPRNVLVDGSGNLYFSEFAGQRVRRLAPDGTITVIAGTGIAGSDGDGGLATQAKLSYPAGLALDSAGNLYIADSGNHKIRKVSGGRITTVLGTGVAGAALATQLYTPTGVAVDSAGTLYVADGGNQRIRKLTATGFISTISSAARDVAVDNAGNVFAAYGAHVTKMLVSGASLNLAGDGLYFSRGDGGPATLARLNSPSGLVLDNVGNLWISDTLNSRIRLVSTDGKITTAAVPLVTPAGISRDASGNLLVAEIVGFRVRSLPGMFTVAGTGIPGFTGEGFPATGSQLSAPNAVAAAPGGGFYIADTGNHRIRRVSASGIMNTVAGNGQRGWNGDGPGMGARLDSPCAIALDASGNLYIADTGNNRIRRLSPDGTLTTLAGPVQLNGPRGIAVDRAGNLWIADTGNNRVLKLTPAGALTIVSDQLQTPVAVCIDDATGALYVADSGTNMVLRFSPPPAAITEAPVSIIVVNAATLLAGPAAPGSLLSIFGAGLANARVLVDGQSVPLLLAQDNQLNFQLPIQSQGQIEVLTGSVSQFKAQLNIVPSAPGIFAASGGTGPVIAANEDGTLNSDASPAEQGTVITFYATGVGQNVAPVVTIGGAQAELLFAGDSPTTIGVFQINVRVPLGIAGPLPLLLSAGAAISQAGVVVSIR